MAVNTAVEVVMPAMGDSVSEGTVLEWHKQEGESVSVDEALVEISPDKVDAEDPAPLSGVVGKIHAAEGETVEVGSVLAEISPDGGAPADPDGDDDDESPVASGNGAHAPAEATQVDVTMPAMGESVSEGVVLEWLKQPGDAVEA